MQIECLKGVGDKTKKLLNKMNITTTKELLMYYPRDYDIFRKPVYLSDIDEEGVHAIAVVIISDVEQKSVKKLNITTVFASDEKGDRIKLTWFNMPFIRNSVRRGYRYIIRGRVIFKGSTLSMEQPKLYTMAEYEEKCHSIQPIYPLIKGVTNNLMIKLVKQCFTNENEMDEFEYLPKDIIDKYGLMPLYEAVKYIHFPRTIEEMTNARQRFAFDEFFTFIMKMNKLKKGRIHIKNNYIIHENELTKNIIEHLPFTLTAPQMKAYSEIMCDMQGNYVMNRLIQGDVGSGKTIIAVLTLINVVFSGYQGALMVPTEVLANQHYEYIVSLVKEHQLNINPVLLVGSMGASAKKNAYKQIESGEADIIIGTHALIQEKVQYKKLALVITDEQHRFGVNQRNTLSLKGDQPHVCVMSATPIPRTLAIILYGDLDISIIDALPCGRLPIKNCVVDEAYRPNINRFITREVNSGHQVYIICPMVFESDISESENVTDYTVKLREELQGISIEGLHGQMSPSQKNEIMERFSRNETSVLVSTTVIEVGINVPNATCMIIENADKFGLAQLHQLRGRVGRGKYQSYCIFVTTSKKKETKERLEIIAGSNDGFYIAEQDLKLRGPGDFFGIRQSGDMNFKIADIYSDANMMKKAKECADYIIENNIEDSIKKTFIEEQIML